MNLHSSIIDFVYQFAIYLTIQYLSIDHLYVPHIVSLFQSVTSGLQAWSRVLLHESESPGGFPKTQMAELHPPEFLI